MPINQSTFPGSARFRYILEEVWTNGQAVRAVEMNA